MAVAALEAAVDTLIIVSNDRLLKGVCACTQHLPAQAPIPSLLFACLLACLHACLLACCKTAFMLCPLRFRPTCRGVALLSRDSTDNNHKPLLTS